MPTDWRGQWLSLPDLARLMGKRYFSIWLLYRNGDLNVPGLRFHRIKSGRGNPIWVQIDQDLYDSLVRPCNVRI